MRDTSMHRHIRLKQLQLDRIVSLHCYASILPWFARPCWSGIPHVHFCQLRGRWPGAGPGRTRWRKVCFLLPRSLGSGVGLPCWQGAHHQALSGMAGSGLSGLRGCFLHGLSGEHLHGLGLLVVGHHGCIHPVHIVNVFSHVAGKHHTHAFEKRQLRRLQCKHVSQQLAGFIVILGVGVHVGRKHHQGRMPGKQCFQSYLVHCMLTLPCACQDDRVGMCLQKLLHAFHGWWLVWGGPCLVLSELLPSGFAWPAGAQLLQNGGRGKGKKGSDGPEADE